MRRWRSFRSELLSSERDECSQACVGEIAEVADANEAPGQHMLAEAAQELACGERHDALLVAVGVVFPSKTYAVTIEAEQAAIADGDAVGIAAEIAQHANGIFEGRLGIDHPVALVEGAHEWRRAVDAALSERLLEQSEILAAEDTAENLDGQKEGIPGMNPARVVFVETAGGNDAVEVRVQAQVLSPGVQDAEEADLGSEMLGICCDFEHGLSASPEEQIEEQPGISLTERVQRMRQSKDDVEVGHGKQVLLTS